MLRYYGRPEFADGVWCGVELDKPEGKNNGSKHGIRYFTCELAYGAFVPAGKVELDTTRRSRSRPNSRPGSRPNSRPSSAERGKAARSDASSATGVRPTAVQHELARLAQPPVTERLTKRKAAQSSVTNWRQPLKAFAAQSKDDASVSKRGAKVPAVAFRTGGSGGMHRAASSENLRGLKELSDQNKSVKKSSSERNLREGNTLPRMAGKSSSKKSRPSLQNVFPSEKEAGAQAWPQVSTPKNDENDGSEAVDGTVSSSHSSDSSSRAPSPQSSANNGFVATPDMPLNSGLATHASQLAESEKHSVGLCQVPSPEAGRSKQCYQNSTSGGVTLAHPLSQAAGQPEGPATPQAVLQLLTQLVQQNQDLRQRQGVANTVGVMYSCKYILTCSVAMQMCWSRSWRPVLGSGRQQWVLSSSAWRKVCQQAML